MVAEEPALSSFVYETVLNHDSLEEAVLHRLGDRLGRDVVSASLIRQTYLEALADEPELAKIFRVDIVAVFDRDPACFRYLEPVLYFKGFHGLQTHRLANWLWRKGPQGFCALSSKPRVRGFPDRHSPGCSRRPWDLHRSRHRHRCRRHGS